MCRPLVVRLSLSAIRLIVRSARGASIPLSTCDKSHLFQSIFGHSNLSDGQKLAALAELPENQPNCHCPFSGAAHFSYTKPENRLMKELPRGRV